jgi:hypothetical protein
MEEAFEYLSHARLLYKDGYRNAYLGEVATPVVYGVQGKLREYYGAKEGPPIRIESIAVHYDLTISPT